MTSFDNILTIKLQLKNHWMLDMLCYMTVLETQEDIIS